MDNKNFNPQKLEKLNNPLRINEFPPELIVQRAKLENPKVIIDLGAGTAFYSVHFAQMFKNCTIYACDISDIMIRWMDSNIVPDYNNIVTMIMDENHVPLEDSIADFLFMVNLHHELDSPEKTLTECYRLLKPDGAIAVSDWKKEKTSHGPSINKRYEPETIKRQLLKAGFISVDIYRDFPQNNLLIAKKQN